MNRRGFVTGLGAVLAAPHSAWAQLPPNVARIGYLTCNLATGLHLRDAFLQGLHDLGYVEGRNVVIEYRSAEGKYERIPALLPQI